MIPKILTATPSTLDTSLYHTSEHSPARTSATSLNICPGQCPCCRAQQDGTSHVTRTIQHLFRLRTGTVWHAVHSLQVHCGEGMAPEFGGRLEQRPFDRTGDRPAIRLRFFSTRGKSQGKLMSQTQRLAHQATEISASTCIATSILHQRAEKPNLSLQSTQKIWIQDRFPCRPLNSRKPIGRTMTMTHSEKSHIHRMKAWPYRQECRGHDPTKKNLFCWCSLLVGKVCRYKLLEDRLYCNGT